MRSHAKASTAGSTMRQTSGRGRISLAALAALGLTALVALTASVASGAVATEYVKSFGPDGTEATDFERINGVAVDQGTGAVYVLDGEAGVLHKFDATGQPLDFTGTAAYISGNEISGLDPFTERNAAQVAVDSTSHVVYVTEEESVRAFQQNGEPALFTAGPGMGTNGIPSFGQLNGVTVDANGAIYASDREAGTVRIYSPSGALLTTFSVSLPGNLAVSPDGTVYVVNSQAGQGVYPFTPSAFPVTAATTYVAGPKLQKESGVFTVGVGVDPTTGDVFVLETNFGATWIKKFDSSGNFVRYYARPGEEGELTGDNGQGVAIVAGGTQFQFYVGDTEPNSEVFSKVAVFGQLIEPGPPSVRSTSASDVAADSATLRAEVNPNTFDTSYHFEYGFEDCSVSSCSSIPLAGAGIGSAPQFVAVSQGAFGLQAGTTYHYRVVAENSEGVTEGPDATFTTQVSGLGFDLADDRAWEMVSPSRKYGGALVGVEAGLVQASIDGEGIAYLSSGSIEAEPEGSRMFELSSVLARRGPAGWRSKDITPPNARVVPLALGHMGEFNLFDPDLSRAVIERRDGTPLSAQASERTPYLAEIAEPHTYTPLVTGKEGFANVPPGTEFGGDEANPVAPVKMVGATSDLSHVALRSKASLAPGAPDNSLYLWSEGQIEPVAVLPASEGGAGVGAAYIGSGPGTVQHAISEDGSRVFWAPGNYGNGGNGLTALYVRDTEAEETARLDVVQPGASGSGIASPVFQGASADGTVVFFTDSRQLTEDASPSERDLYRCEIPPGAASSGCATLANVSAPLAGSGESADVLGIRSALSDDASRIYFVARGVLDEAPNQQGDSAISGAPNLYFWEEGEDTRFIATLADEDHSAWGGGLTFRLNAAGSPSGRYLAFMSQRSLTGYDNRDTASGEPLQEAFRYDAIGDQLHCVSCNPTEGRPEGADPGVLVDPRDSWVGTSPAAILPQVTIEETAGISFYQPRSILDNGRAFFNAVDSLVPADSNGQWDVYQWEPTGLGDCNASSGGASIARSAGGCLSLISSGSAEEEAGFLDASATGNDVFFLTPAKLSVTDEDSELDVYDARVNGVTATLPPNAECLGEACQPAAAAPNDPTPASAGFRGQGNPKPNARKRCAKGKRQVRRSGKTRCVTKKKARKGKAAKRRRASR